MGRTGRNPLELLRKVKYHWPDSDETQACLATFINNLYTHFHENPTRDLVGDITSRMEGWADGYGVHTWRSFSRFVKNVWKNHISGWLQECFIERYFTLFVLKYSERIPGLLNFPFATFMWPQSDSWSPRCRHEHTRVFVPFHHDISFQRDVDLCTGSLSSYQASSFKRSDHKINRYNSLYINCVAYLL
jgi:hypothetical protein